MCVQKISMQTEVDTTTGADFLSYVGDVPITIQGSHLLIWFNFNPSMDK